MGLVDQNDLNAPDFYHDYHNHTPISGNDRVRHL